MLEDETLVAMYIEDALEGLGYAFVGATRVEEALEVIETCVVHMALLDVNLGPGGQSYPVAEELDRRGIPFVFATGYGAKGLREDFKDRPVLPKPFSEAQLAEAMTALRE